LSPLCKQLATMPLGCVSFFSLDSLCYFSHSLWSES